MEFLAIALELIFKTGALNHSAIPPSWALDRVWSDNLRFTKPLLYQLSYRGKVIDNFRLVVFHIYGSILTDAIYDHSHKIPICVLGDLQT